MADDEQSATPEVEVVPETPAAPAPDPVAELRAELAQMRDQNAAQQQATLGMMQQGFSMLATSQQAPTVAPDVSDDKINEMFAEGRAADAMRIVAQREATRQSDTLRRDAIDPLRGQVEGAGIPALAALAFETTRPSLEHYDEFKGDIDKAIAGLDPSLRISPQNIRAAYAIVVGQPDNVKKLEQRAYERGVRAARENPASMPGAPGRSSAEDEEQVATPVQLKERGLIDQASVDMIKGYGGVQGFTDRYIAKQRKPDGSPRFPNGWSDWVKDFDTEGTA